MDTFSPVRSEKDIEVSNWRQIKCLCLCNIIENSQNMETT